MVKSDAPVAHAAVPGGLGPYIASKGAVSALVRSMALDYAAGIVWLLSDRASYATGSELVVDGGLLARAGVDQ